MSNYSTGELAKLCNTTVRTVQYYDNIGLLVPSDLTEGGRRLYNDNDYKKLSLICLLKSLGISLNNIKEIIESENSNKVLSMILNQQKNTIQQEIEDKQKQLQNIAVLEEGIKTKNKITSKEDIYNIMNDKKEMKKTYIVLTCFAVVIGLLIQWPTILMWIIKGNYIPYLVGLPIRIIGVIFLLKYYYSRTAYICPECNTKFKSKVKQFVFAKHTLKTRKLTCNNCGKTSFCLETYSGATAK